MRIKTALITATLFLLGISSYAQTIRIKDAIRVEGARSNQLVGYGLVVGLDGTGDSQQTQFTVQSVTNMLNRFGIQVSASQVKVKNVAAVMVTADLPAFVKSGDRIDIQISSMGDAKSLQGGTLLQTPLFGADQQVYAVGQGGLSIGGFSAGGGGSSVSKNHPTVARIPNGALVEKEVPMSLVSGDSILLSLEKPDFTMASKIAKAIENNAATTAKAEDGGRVRVKIPQQYAQNPVDFIAKIEDIPVEMEPVAKIVINERTGTIVIGGAARLSPVAVSQGGLTVTITQDITVSQPPALSGGSTVVKPTKQVTAKEQTANTLILEPGNTLEDLVKALNAIKATPRDIIAILQAIKEAGGLSGELEIL